MQRTRRTRLIAVLTVVLATLGALYVIEPRGLGMLAYLVPFAPPVIAWVGVSRAPRESRMMPVLLAIGLTASAAGDLTWTAHSMLLGHDPMVSPADAMYVTGYLALGWMLLVVTMVRRGGRLRVDGDAVIDVATVALISVLVFWNLSLRHIVADGSMPELHRIIHSIYPAADAVLLALTVRALWVRRTRRALGSPFAVGVSLWLTADIGYVLFGTEAEISTLFDIIRTLGALLMATAAFRGHVLTVPEWTPERAVRSPMRTLAIAIVPLVLPPLKVLFNDLSGRSEVSAGQAFVVMSLLAGLTFARTSRLLTSERLVRAELASARDEALAGSRAKSAFLATMSHEIRTPMNGVIGLTGLILDTKLDTRQRQYAEGVQSAGDALLSVINDVLDFSKIEAGHLELEQLDFDLVDVVEDVAELVADPARVKQLELLAYCSPELPRGLRGDPARIRQVLLNLAGNAVKFTSAGEVVVRAHLESRSADGAIVRFEVVDTGIGIDEKDRVRLFDAFSQADSSTTRQYGGTGLGLAISQQLVAAMGGRIGVDSVQGEGSTFWFTVPLAFAEDGSINRTRRLDDLSGLRLLVVDDNNTNRMILHEQLIAWGLDVAVADGGAAALTSLRKASRRGEPFHLAILDMCMPEMDGLDLARTISADPALAGTALALLTSNAEVSPTDARAAGIAATLTKPVHLSRLQAALQKIAPNHPQPAPTEVAMPAPAAPHHRRGRVLVVEDGEINQMVATGMLESLGYTVDIAENGRLAVEALLRTTYDAVFMDVQMPVMDGYEATGEIRRMEGSVRHTPIIAMTAGAIDGDRERCLAAGMDDYISKPVDVRTIERALTRWVEAAA